MPVIINGTTGISGVDGSAGTPAFQGSDANTGIRFGTDIVSLVTGGSDRLYIDSSGRLGIGTTNPESLVHINGDATAFRVTRGSSIGFAYNTGTSVTDPFRIQSNGGAVDLYSAVSQPITFSAGTTEKARIDGSGRLLVGTSSGNLDLQIKTAGGFQVVNAQEIALRYNMYNDSGDKYIQSTNKASSLVLDSNGKFLFYNTNTASTSAGSSVTGLTLQWSIDAFGSLVGAATSAFVAPYVYNTTTATATNVNVDASGFLRRSTSSIKYKTNVETIEDQYADAILRCRPVWYQSTCEADNPTWGYWGFIAEEVAAIDPRLCFFKEEEDGTLEPEGVQYDRFVPHLLNLIKRQGEAISELQAEVIALKAS